MIVKRIAVHDALETYAYFYIDEKTKRGWLIDAGAEPQKLLDIIRQNDWKIEAILLTHGHFDHIGAVEKISKELNIPYLIHHEGEKYLKNPQFNLSSFFARQIVLNNAEYFDDNDIISLSNDSAKLKVIHTPGHTLDSVIFYDEKNYLAFVGDTIFKAGYGNTQFPGGNEKVLMNSIKQKIFALPEKTVLYSGHSDETTVAMEKQREWY